MYEASTKYYGKKEGFAMNEARRKYHGMKEGFLIKTWSLRDLLKLNISLIVMNSNPP